MIFSFIKLRSLCDSYETIYMWPPWGRGDICFIGLPKVSPKGSHLCLCCARSCPTLCDPMDCSPPGYWSMGFSRQESWSGMPLSPLGVFLTQGSHPYLPRLLLCRWILHPWATWEAPSVSVQPPKCLLLFRGLSGSWYNPIRSWKKGVISYSGNSKLNSVNVTWKSSYFRGFIIKDVTLLTPVPSQGFTFLSHG